jgi:hypothetical protein
LLKPHPAQCLIGRPIRQRRGIGLRLPGHADRFIGQFRQGFPALGRVAVGQPLEVVFGLLRSDCRTIGLARRCRLLLRRLLLGLLVPIHRDAGNDAIPSKPDKLICRHPNLLTVAAIQREQLRLRCGGGRRGLLLRRNRLGNRGEPAGSIAAGR